MSHKVAISNLLKESEIKTVTADLNSYYHNIEIILNPSEADLYIVPLNQMISVMKPKCLTITPLALKQSIEKNINFFTEKFNSKKIINFYLQNMRVKLLIEDVNLGRRIRNKVLEMQGIIVDSNPDILISAQKITTKNFPTVPIDWVEAQFVSNAFIDPDSYNKSTSRKLKKPNAKKTPVAYAKMLSTQTDGVQAMMQMSENTPPIENFFRKSQAQIRQQEKEEQLIREIMKKQPTQKAPKIEDSIFPVPPADVFDELLEEDRKKRENIHKERLTEAIEPKENTSQTPPVQEKKKNSQTPPEVNIPIPVVPGASIGDWLIEDSESESDCEDEDIEKHLNETKTKVQPFLVSPKKSPKRIRPRSQFDMSSESDIDSPIKKAIAPPPLPKKSVLNSPIRKACSQTSPNFKRVCQSIMSMKPAHINESHNHPGPTLEETIQFTQRSQLSQQELDNIDYGNPELSQVPIVSPTRDPLMLALLD